MVENMPEFVEWREEHINQERGSRVVHYYLEDSSGKSYLAVIGTERSLRHMLYVASQEFYETFGAEKWGVSILKWRSKREVIDWLTSFIPGRMTSLNYFRSPQAHLLTTDAAFNELSDVGWYQHKYPELVRNSCEQILDIEWSGDSWCCGKQLRHYRAFTRNGITISTHSFVLVMSEQENRYLAYLEDMYEDKKGQKKIKVRWFHQNQEVTCKIPLPKPHPCEVFFTPFSQVISAECVDDIAMVLTPDHYEKCLATLSYSSSLGIRLCFRQYNKNKFKLFDIRSLRGYFNQPILSCLDIDEFGQGSTIKSGGSKRIKFVKRAHKMLGHVNHRNLKYDLTMSGKLPVKLTGPSNLVVPPFSIGGKIELLCQDSGIRGCWFKCTVLQFSHKRLKVRYDDLQDEDGCGNLEEWVPANRMAAPDKLNMRCSGRLNVRPCPSISCLTENDNLDVGTAVDTWWSDGWWEGIVIGIENFGDDSVQVYFPGEDIYLICQRKNLRVSKDWVDNKWIDMKAKLDILSAISLVSPQAKLNSCSILAKHAESGSSAMSDHVAIDAQANGIGEDKQMEASQILKLTTCPIPVTQVNWNDDDGSAEADEQLNSTTSPIPVTQVILIDDVDGSAEADEQLISTTCPIPSTQVNLNDEDGPAEADEQLNSRKRPRDEATEENLDVDNS